jgi:hypothetical protein
MTANICLCTCPCSPQGGPWSGRRGGAAVDHDSRRAMSSYTRYPGHSCALPCCMPCCHALSPMKYRGVMRTVLSRNVLCYVMLCYVHNTPPCQPHPCSLHPPPLPATACSQVPYSEHSSFRELHDFVSWLQPAEIIPSVSNDQVRSGYPGGRQAPARRSCILHTVHPQGQR